MHVARGNFCPLFRPFLEKLIGQFVFFYKYKYIREILRNTFCNLTFPFVRCLIAGGSRDEVELRQLHVTCNVHPPGFHPALIIMIVSRMLKVLMPK